MTSKEQPPATVISQKATDAQASPSQSPGPAVERSSNLSLGRIAPKAPRTKQTCGHDKQLAVLSREHGIARAELKRAASEREIDLRKRVWELELSERAQNKKIAEQRARLGESQVRVQAMEQEIVNLRWEREQGLAINGALAAENEQLRRQLEEGE